MNNLWDIHCHIIPTIDDGPKNIETSLTMLKTEYDQGVTNIILTPHYRAGMFDTTLEGITTQYDVLRKALKEEAEKEDWASKMNLFLGCEFHANMDMVELYRKKAYPTMAGTSYVLVEFSSTDSFSFIKGRCQAMLYAGFIPIVAHAERYRDLRKNNLDNIADLSQMGVKIQVNAESIIGKSGFMTKLWCHKAIKEELVDFIGSDAHDTSERTVRIGECYKVLDSKFGHEAAEFLLIANPRKAFGKTGK